MVGEPSTRIAIDPPERGDRGLGEMIPEPFLLHSLWNPLDVKLTLASRRMARRFRAVYHGSIMDLYGGGFPIGAYG